MAAKMDAKARLPLVEEKVLHGREMVTKHYDEVSKHETSTRYAIIDPILWALGWETWNPKECQVEYQRGHQGRVDYALFDRWKKAVIVVEAKRLDKNSAAFERQLSKYSRGIGEGVGVLTDGEIWHLYDLRERGRFEDKYIYKVDIAKHTAPQCARKLNRWLRKERWW